jgi:Ca2+-binding EF-hand superfamily protein
VQINESPKKTAGISSGTKVLHAAVKPPSPHVAWGEDAPVNSAASPQITRDAVISPNVAGKKRLAADPSDRVDPVKIDLLEDRLREKLEQKMKGKHTTSSPFAIKKYFRYFDQNNDGGLQYGEFKQCCAQQFGFQANETELRALFNRFDAKRTGSIDYDLLINRVMSTETVAPLGNSSLPSYYDKQQDRRQRAADASSSPSYDTAGHSSLHPPLSPANEALVIAKLENELRDKIRGRLTSGPYQLMRAFKHFDKDNNGGVDRGEFGEVLRNFGFEAEPRHIDALFRKYDANASGALEFHEFVNKLQPDGSENPLGKSKLSEIQSAYIQEQQRVKASSEEGMAEQVWREQDDLRAEEQNAMSRALFLEEQLREKAAGNLSSGPYEMRRTFKYFDRDGSGTVELSEFKEALKRFHFNASDKDIKTLFSLYDANGDGKVGSQEFLQRVFPESLHNPLGPSIVDAYYAEKEANVNAQVDKVLNLGDDGVNHLGDENRVKTPALTAQHVDNLVVRLQDKINQRLKGGPYGLRRAFKHFDSDGSGSISYDEFKRCMENFGFQVAPREMGALFRRFDHDGEGSIDYSEFCNHVLPNNYQSPLGPSHLNQIHADFRQQLKEPVDAAELIPSVVIQENVENRLREKMDNMKNGTILLRRAFSRQDMNRDGHVDRLGLRQALDDMHVQADARDIDALFERFDKSGGGKLPYTEVIAAVQPSPMRSVLGPSNLYQLEVSALEKNTPKKDSDFETDVSKEDTSLLERGLRERLENRLKGGPYLLRRQFKRLDKDGDGLISYPEFTETLKSFGFHASNEQMRGLFNKYDNDASGSITYQEFMDHLLPFDYYSPLGNVTTVSGESPRRPAVRRTPSRAMELSRRTLPPEVDASTVEFVEKRLKARMSKLQSLRGHIG